MISTVIPTNRSHPSFGYEPLFIVGFEDDQFVAYTYRPRFRHEWLWWLGGLKIASKPESVTEAVAYLTQFATNLEWSSVSAFPPYAP
jgi:hypothetical protein